MSRRPAIAAVLLSLVSATAVAQDFNFKAAPRITRPNAVSGGLIRPTFSGADAPDAGARTGFTVGVRSSQQLRTGVILEAGVGVASRGATESFSGSSATTTITSVEAPVLVRLGGTQDGTFGLPQRITIAAGAVANFNVACNQKFTSGSFTSSSKCTDESAVDLAAVIGAGFAANIGGRPIIIDALFTNGFVRVFKDYKVFNRSLGVRFIMPIIPTVGIPIKF